MDETFVKVTNVAYRIIEFFPEGDPLKNRAKDRVLSVMETATHLLGTDGWMSLQREKAKTELVEDIDILLGYFWIAKAQGWLSPTNYLILHQAYADLKRSIGPVKEFTRKIPFNVPQVTPEAQETSVLEPPRKPESPEPVEKPVIATNLPPRQQKILEYLASHSQAQVMDLEKLLGGVTKRTIRRDLDELLEAKKIVRKGEFNQVSYALS